MSKHSRSRDSSSSPEPPSKRKRSISPHDVEQETPVFVFIVDAKLDSDTMAELVSAVEDSQNAQLELCGNVQDSDIIVTAIRMKKRLERHLDWKFAKQKSIVTPEWLKDSIEQRKLLPCGDYAALKELVESTESHCPESICLTDEECTHVHGFLLEASPDVSNDEEAHPGLFQRYACRRHSPLACVNQKLVDQFSILRRHRELEGWQVRALSYERTIAVFQRPKGTPTMTEIEIAYPHLITNVHLDELAKVPFLGEKAMFKVAEYLRLGYISESHRISSDPRYNSLVAFSSIHGIGPSTARKLYSLDLRTMRDLDVYHDVNPDPNVPIADKLAALPRVFDSVTNIPRLTIQVGLVLRQDMNEKIPREEVEEMRDVVMAELKHIRQGCISTITGGYRRGKPKSNDVDIVISHSDLKSGKGQVQGLCTELVKRLHRKGLVTHVMHRSSFHEHNTLRTSHWDSLEKALTVFILPANGKSGRRVHRRLDLIFAAPEVYWTAVVGWTGSKMFERDLRLWAKEERGMKFDSSGISRRHDSKLYFPKSEQEVFELLGLAWVDPTMRNADA